MFSGFRVTGLRELNRSFALISDELKAQTVDQLEHAAEPARSHAEELAVANIRNIGPVWSRVKSGVTVTSVYIAPQARRHGGSPRPNLAGLLMRRSLLPGAEDSMPEIEERLDLWLDRLGGEAGF